MKQRHLLIIMLLLFSLVACSGDDSAATINISAPSDLTVTAGEYAGQAMLSWSSVADASEYSLYYATESFASLDDTTNYASLSNGAMLTNQTSPVTISGLNNSTSYYFVVTAGDGTTESDASSEVSVLVYAPLSDTGITTCSNATTNGLDCPETDFEGQDAEYGRDVTYNDDSDGRAGFSYTKLDSSGNVLAASAASWSCVQDNVTGLIWEVKTNDAGLHDKGWTYTWYNSTGVNDGGSVGTENSGRCIDTTNCDTEKYVAAVNTATLCGYDDWRLPSIEELSSLVDSSIASPGPTIDTDWFPNTVAFNYWSASPDADADFSNDAWYVYFNNGGVYDYFKYYANNVRVVRGGQ